MKELLLVITLFFNSSLATASVPVESDQTNVCPKEKAQTARTQDATAPRSNTAPATTTPRARGGSLNGTRSASQRWNSFLPGMIR